MGGVVEAGTLEAGGGVAVRTAEQAGIVGADILADHTPAGFALGGVFLMCSSTCPIIRLKVRKKLEV